MKVAVCFLSKDRVELSKQSWQPINNHRGQFHPFWVDGSVTKEGEELPYQPASSSGGWPAANVRSNVRGGAGAAIVYALTETLNHREMYDAIQLVENDVLLPDTWFDDTVALFERARADGLEVGAATARTFEDRILFQRDGYAVLHNIGAGCVMLTRKAARIVLDTFNSGWTTDNRRIFCQLSGVDIGTFWAFRFNEHPLVADWKWDAVLAAHGLASVGCTPSHVQMIGQDPPLAEQGLTIVDGPVEARRDDAAFEVYRNNLHRVHEGALRLGVETEFQYEANSGIWKYAPHQMPKLGGVYSGDWRLRELRGNGEFGWLSAEGEPLLVFPAFGAVVLTVSGGKDGGKVEVEDEGSGFKVSPYLPPEGDQGTAMQINVPAGISYRNIRLTALTPGVCFYGMVTREKQPVLTNVRFDHNTLPPP